MAAQSSICSWFVGCGLVLSRPSFVLCGEPKNRRSVHFFERTCEIGFSGQDFKKVRLLALPEVSRNSAPLSHKLSRKGTALIPLP
jgi:hypothetical protein